MEVHARSGKQKLNVNSGIECELIDMSKYCPFNLWQIVFMGAQTYPLHNNILFQDNQSAMKMEINDRNACTGNSRHVHIRYLHCRNP